MQVIYEPTGKAREFGDLACNLYTGCSHGCTYCYAPAVLRKTREDFGDDPKPRKGILNKLVKDAEKLRDSTTPVFLCFLCDPYQPIEEHFGITRKAIEILNGNNIPVNILTKGGRRAIRDFDLLKRNSLNWFGVTCTYSNPASSEVIEPLADYPHRRIDALRQAKSLGINTWMSLEPIVAPRDALENIKASLQWCDLYKIGKLNHRSGMGPSEGELRDLLKEAVALLESKGKKYYIKLDTRPYL